MEGVDPVTNSPGDIKYTSWTLEAPSIPKDMTNTYKPKVRIFYTYKTTASTSIPILSKNKYQRLKQLRKTLPRQAQTLVSGGPLDVQIYTETPVITKSKTFTVKTTIRNLRGGSVFNSSIIGTDIDTKDLNWIRIKITTPLEAKDCPGLGEYAYIRTRAGETVHNCELIMPDVETMENMPFIVELEYGYFFDISTAIRVRGE